MAAVTILDNGRGMGSNLSPVGVPRTPTLESVEAAKAQAVRERRELLRATGIGVGEDGRVVFAADVVGLADVTPESPSPLKPGALVCQKCRRALAVVEAEVIGTLMFRCTGCQHSWSTEHFAKKP